MQNLMEMMKIMNLNVYDVGSEHWVDVTYIENPNHFYVRPTAYRDYLSDLSSYGDRYHPKELNVGSITVYKSKLFKCYARGRIIFTNNEGEVPSCDIFALDYGCFESGISFKRIRKALHPVDVQPLAILCELADCKPLNLPWSTEAIESMKFFVGKERAKMIVKGKSPHSLIVELFNTCPEDISTMLAYSGHSTFGFSHNEISRLTKVQPEKHYFTYKQLEIDDTLIVRVLTGDSLKDFYVADVNDYKNYVKGKENFTQYARKQTELQSHELKEGMAVGVLIITNNKYERAIVTRITVPEEKAIVKLVDLGKSFEVPIVRLKIIKSEFFFKQPVVAIYCSAEESQIWDNGLHRFLYPGFEFKITIKKVGDKFENPHVVNLAPKT